MHCRSGSKKDPLHALPHSIARQLFRMECFSEVTQIVRDFGVTISYGITKLMTCARDYLKWYQHWQFGASGDHGSNICIEMGTPANRRRAGGGLYVWETAFTVQRALCTFWVKVTPCRRPPLSLRNVQTLVPINLNLQNDAKTKHFRL